MIYYENCVDQVKLKTDLSNYRLDQLFQGYRIMWKEASEEWPNPCAIMNSTPFGGVLK